MKKNTDRTALLIHCSVEEAEQIRDAARKQERTISSYVLRAVRGRLNAEAQIQKTQKDFFQNYVEKAPGLIGMRPPKTK
ncbi:MAG TPA: hypothetical protein VGS27_36155 [Candidatus Sulfotelmatobacter sp.]|nr:hypothetical protein [Candidatus Sulfotelmatobacter sp.]